MSKVEDAYEALATREPVMNKWWWARLWCEHCHHESTEEEIAEKTPCGKTWWRDVKKKRCCKCGKHKEKKPWNRDNWRPESREQYRERMASYHKQVAGMTTSQPSPISSQLAPPAPGSLSEQYSLQIAALYPQGITVRPEDSHTATPLDAS